MSELSVKSAAVDLNQHRRLAGGFVLLAVVFNLYYLWPEAVRTAPQFNDMVLHWQALQTATTDLAVGLNPTDFWLSTIGLGYPFFHHYQHLAYLPPALLFYLSGGVLPLSTLFNSVLYLLLSFWPVSIYYSMRRLEFERLPAALAGLVASLISTNGLLGLEFGSYIWRGSGLYTQLWGMFWLPLALAQGFTTLRLGRGYALSTLFLAVVFLGHPVMGYIAVFSLLALAGVLVFSNIGRTALFRLLGLLSLLALTTAYFWVPYSLDLGFMNRSVWEEAVKYNSYGHVWTLSALFRGELFDFGRPPMLTVLAGLGVLVCLRRWRQLPYRVPLTLAVLWLLLFMGRPTWGPLLDLLPFSRDLHFHRLISGIHLAGVYLMGLGLAWLVTELLRFKLPGKLLLGCLFVGFVLAPVYLERAVYLDQNRLWMAESQAAFARESGDFNGLLETLRSLPPGRVYAGLGNNWGRDYKIGAAPVYALIADAGLNNLGYLYHALALTADVQVLFDETNLEHYRLFNVRYLVLPADRPAPVFAHFVRQFGRHCLYAIPTSGYFDLVNTQVAFTGTKDDFFPAAAAWLKSSLLVDKQYPALFFAPTQNRLTRLPLDKAAQLMPAISSPPAPLGSILVEKVSAAGYSAEIQSDQPAALLLKTTYHPGWQAAIDGLPVEVMMVMPGFVGVLTPPGSHLITFVYQPASGRTMLIFSGLLLILLLAIFERWPHLWPLRFRMLPGVTHRVS
jgi:hypothetical protein